MANMAVLTRKKKQSKKYNFSEFLAKLTVWNVCMWLIVVKYGFGLLFWDNTLHTNTTPLHLFCVDKSVTTIDITTILISFMYINRIECN